MTPPDHPHPRLAFIGGGTMAHAITAGCVASGTLDPRRLVVADPDPSKHHAFHQLRVATVGSAAAALHWLREHEALAPHEPLGQVLLAIKPQMLPSAAPEIAAAAGPARRVIISILAGTVSTRIRSALGQQVAVIRAMPNTPARIGRSTTALSLGDGASPGDESLARQIFRGIGPTVIDCDESLMDAFTAVGGSGPAYVFYLAQAMIDVAVELGFTPAVADQVVRGTLSGAAELLLGDPASPAELRAAVTSKGGTTAAATRVLDDSLVRQSLMNAIRAARDRGSELARL